MLTFSRIVFFVGILFFVGCCIFALVKYIIDKKSKKKHNNYK